LNQQRASTSSTTKGRKEDDLLKRLVIRHTSPEGNLSYSCIAPECDHRCAGNLQRARILRHSVKCQYLRAHDSAAFEDAVNSSRTGSLGAQLEAPSSHDVEASQPQKSSKLQATFSDTLAGPITRQGTLNLAPLRVAGKKANAEETKKYQNSVDHIIMRLICVRGLVPNVLDSPEWKELMNKLNGTYKPSSSDAFRDRFIPQEAVFVQSKQIELLKAEEDLTLTFDGTTIRSNESFYTAHATTPSRQSFFLDGHEGNGESHDRKWITDNLMKVSLFYELMKIYTLNYL
jgi:hypothetical protein